MKDPLLRIGVSNLLISLALAIVAWAVHTTGKRPLVAHLLWLLVLAKLVTPPILMVPVVPVHGLTAATVEPLTDHSALQATSTGMLLLGPDGSSASFDGGTSALVEIGKTGLILIWVLGSVCVLTWGC